MCPSLCFSLSEPHFPHRVHIPLLPASQTELWLHDNSSHWPKVQVHQAKFLPLVFSTRREPSFPPFSPKAAEPQGDEINDSNDERMRQCWCWDHPLRSRLGHGRKPEPGMPSWAQSSVHLQAYRESPPMGNHCLQGVSTCRKWSFRSCDPKAESGANPIWRAIQGYLAGREVEIESSWSSSSS